MISKINNALDLAGIEHYKRKPNGAGLNQLMRHTEAMTGDQLRREIEPIVERTLASSDYNALNALVQFAEDLDKKKHLKPAEVFEGLTISTKDENTRFKGSTCVGHTRAFLSNVKKYANLSGEIVAERTNDVYHHVAGLYKCKDSYVVVEPGFGKGEKFFIVPFHRLKRHELFTLQATPSQGRNAILKRTSQRVESVYERNVLEADTLVMKHYLSDPDHEFVPMVGTANGGIGKVIKVYLAKGTIVFQMGSGKHKKIVGELTFAELQQLHDQGNLAEFLLAYMGNDFNTKPIVLFMQIMKILKVADRLQQWKNSVK